MRLSSILLILLLIAFSGALQSEKEWTTIRSVVDYEKAANPTRVKALNVDWPKLFPLLMEDGVEHLWLRGVRLPDDDSTVGPDIARLTTLKTLRLEYVEIKPREIRKLSDHQDLRELKLAFSELGDDHYAALTKLTQLTYFYGGFCQDLTRKGLLQLRKLAGLKRLELHGLSSLSIFPGDFSDAIRGLSLEELSLWGALNLDEDDFAAIARMNTLSSLTLLGVVGGAEHIKQLENLSLSKLTLSATRASQETLEALVKSQPLKWLDLTFGAQVDGELFSDWGKSKGLVKLWLGYSGGNIEGKGEPEPDLSSLEKLEHLEYIEFSGERISRNDVVGVLAKIESLRVVRIHGGKRLLRGTVLMLAELPNLESIVVYGMSRYSRRTLGQLAEDFDEASGSRGVYISFNPR